MPQNTYVGTSATADGAITSTSTVYATARSGNALVSTDTNTALIGDTFWSAGIGQESFSGTFALHQSFIKFDTSSIPADATIDSGTLKTNFQSARDNGGISWIGEIRVFDWGVALTTADWVAGADMSAKTLVGTLGVAAMVGTPNWVSLAAMTSNIAKAGTTYFVLTDNNFTGGTAPGAANDGRISSADNATPGNRPELTVVYTTVGGITYIGKYWG